MDLRPVTLEDKYTATQGRVFLTGIQALVRVPIMQRLRDLAAGHNTAGYISGYRGSPLGGYDQQLGAAKKLLVAHHVKFQPGVNEDLAATACWGTQMAQLHGEGKYDGVFGIWYGKGPGVNRSGDAFRHGNLAGSSPLGGVLVLMGDDHTCESSTTAHQSEFALVNAMIPILSPAGVQEIIDYGLYGYALSRYSGCWIGIKCVHDTVNTAATADIDPARMNTVAPADFAMPEGGLNIRWPDAALAQEARLHNVRIPAVRAFARANPLDRAVFPNRGAKLGIVTAGKSYLDVRSALADLNIDEAAAARLGLAMYKVAMTWPLEPTGMREFCRGLDLVIVVEEKRGLMEAQLKDILYGSAGAPRVIGKTDETGAPLFLSSGALDPNHIAAVVGARVVALNDDAELAERVAAFAKLHAGEHAGAGELVRTPYFCAGCPHSSSTHVPEGSRALAGIGCHFLAQFMDRRTAGYTQMGGEGASWIGEAPFSTRQHVFQNIGDGTYYHSGLLAIRAAVAAEVNVTFKVLFNDAVSMTGGQAHDGPLNPALISQQLSAEGAKRVVVVTDEPDKYPPGYPFAAGVEVYHRDELDRVQRELREIPGMTGLIYDQTCAAEKRRRRKRKILVDPPKRTLINEAVCEGCGDCGVKSNCVAVAPLETEFGRKRQIDQSVCNKDFSCVKGFCPSFVTVIGGDLRKVKPQLLSTVAPLAEPAPIDLDGRDRAFAIAVTGIGGTGIVTVGAILGMAAHLEGKSAGILDMTGLAQKNGAVVSHLRIAARQEQIQSVRIPAHGADLLIGGDVVVSAQHETLRILRPGAARGVVNTHEQMTGDFTRNANLRMPGQALQRKLAERMGVSNVHFVNANRLATALCGDSIATNLFLVGYAYQHGMLPLGALAIERAIELNGAAVEMNKQAFRWGRRAALDLAAVEQAAAPAAIESPKLSGSLDELIERRVQHLTTYQDAAYAARYRTLVEKVRAAEATILNGHSRLTEAVARYYAKLLAYKDEYEVARLYTDGAFEEKIRAMFEGDYTLEFHLSPPILEKPDPVTGEAKKRRFGAWMMPAFRLLAKLKGLRGGGFDVFGYSAERRTERQLILDYERLIEQVLAGLARHNHDTAVALASVPEDIRGFGHVKLRHLRQAKQREAELLAAFNAPEQSLKQAA